MGMDVIACTATPKHTKESRRHHGYVVPGTGDEDGTVPSEWYSGLDRASLHHFLAQKLDHLVISVPLTDATMHLLGKEEFDILSQSTSSPSSSSSHHISPFISNISRGKVIKQDELIDALKDGRLGGAALDVTDPEPLPQDSPLWTMDNIFVSPHISAASTTVLGRAFDVLDMNITRLEKGERLINVVKRRRGY